MPTVIYAYKDTSIYTWGHTHGLGEVMLGKDSYSPPSPKSLHSFNNS